ncbi:unnamed protein product [Ectocarpus sp. 12 AP-2014]
MVSVSHMLNCARPGVNGTNLLRTIRNKLEGVTGGPQLSRHLINGRHRSTASLELCYHILENMLSGRKWRSWRERSGQAFKQSLREHVESQPEQQDFDQHIEEVGPKASALHKSLVGLGITGPGIRVDEATGEASLIDLVRMLCPDKTPDYVKKTLSRVIAQDGNGDLESPLAGRVHYIKINGHGQVTPVGDAKTAVEVAWLLPSTRAKEFRRQSAETICRVLGGDVTLCEEIEERCARLQSTEEGMAFQQFMTGEQPQAKRARFGPPAMMHATDEDYEKFVKMEVNHELAMRNDRYAHELATGKTNHIREQLQDEVGIVLTMKEAFEAIRPLGDTETIELSDKMTDISYRMFKKMGGGTTAAADPGHGVATPQCHASVRGDEISIAQISGFMGVRLGSLAGRVGKRMKQLYIAQYGAVAGDNIPKRTTRFNGKPFSENVYFARDRRIMEQAIREVAQI